MSRSLPLMCLLGMGLARFWDSAQAVPGRPRRWRFTVGCAGARTTASALGAAAAEVWATTAVGAAGVGLYASAGTRYGLAACCCALLLHAVVAAILILAGGLRA
jgi:hypothetical protein